MKKQFLFFTLVLLSIFVYGIDVFVDIPKSNGFVSDYENIFTPEQSENLKNILSEYESETSIEIAVLTISDYGDDIFEFAQETATQWGIGKEGIDNGLLIIISKSNKKIRAQTGYGLEGYLPDGYLSEIGDSIARSYFKNEQYYEGVLLFINSCKARIEKEGGYTEETNEELIKNTPNIFITLLKRIPLWVWLLLGGIWILIFIINPKLALDILLYIFYILSQFAGSKNSDSKGFGGGKFGGGGSTSNW